VYVFTVFAPHIDGTFPVLYALMTMKTQALYRAVFHTLKDLAPNCQPLSAMADFEKAAVSAFRKVDGNVNVAGCWFHYAQAIVKRVNKLGMKADYHHDVADLPLLRLFNVFLVCRSFQAPKSLRRATVGHDGRRTCKQQEVYTDRRRSQT